MRSIAVLLLAAGLGMAGPKGKVRDVTHPRSPGTPLAIKFDPWYCPLCVKEERIEPQEKKIRMMRMPVEELAKVLDLDRKWLVIETPHFKLLSTLGRASVKFKDVPYARADLLRLKTIFPKLGIGREGATVNTHQRAHLYHIRVERLYSHFAALTDNKKKYLGMDAPYEVYLLDDYAEYSTLTDQFLGKGMRMAGIQHHSREKPAFYCFMTSEQQVGRTKGKGDRLFSNWVTHNVAHLLIDGFDNYYRETWAWLEEGLAHYYERKESTRSNVFCFTEGKPPQGFLKPDWEAVIYNLVRRGRDPSLSQWCEKLTPGELTGVENGLSWSIVKWLVETEPIRFTKLVRKLNDYENKPTAAESIEYAFGVSPGVLHTRWREYVRENYGKKR